MVRRSGAPLTPELARLTREELKSLTHGEFWIPEAERASYQSALRALNAAGVPYVVSGLYAMYQYTGIYRQTKDLDLLLEPRYVLTAAGALKDVGFHLRLEQSHWLAKADRDEAAIDLIYGMGNGLFLIDQDWYRHSRAALLAATPVRVAPPEDLIWHRLFIWERHRADVADVVHLILARGDEIDWDRLLIRVGEHWRLLLMQIQFFDYVYPGYRPRIPTWVREELYERGLEEIEKVGPRRIGRGTLVSRFSFAIDVNEWGFRDLREEAIGAVRRLPIVREIRAAAVWDENAEAA